MRSYMACFIVFEGGDGSGKSTQVRSLMRRLRRRGVNVLRTREPGGTRLGQALRTLLKSGEPVTPISELMLFEAARALLVQQVIKPFLAEYGVVIADRFTSSTAVSYTHLRAHEPREDLVCRLLLEKKTDKHCYSNSCIRFNGLP